jgi:CelD/BcsL family acetyltransferase involved in cellulose biosynthesis
MPMLSTSSLDSVKLVSRAEPAGPALSFRLVTDFAELQAVAPAWQELLEKSADREPMMAPAWLLTWWQIYGENSGRALRVGLFYDGERLVGLAPLCQREYRYRLGIPFTRLEFLGSDVEAQDGVCSMYLSLLARAGLEGRVADAFVKEMARGSFGFWHEIFLSALNGAVAAPDRLLEAFRSVGCHGLKTVKTDAPYLKLPATWDAYLKSLKKKHRKYIKGALRDFEAWAGTDWKLEFARTPDELAKGERLLAELHNQRWHQAGGITGAFARPRFAAFHEAYMPLLFREGKLELFWLTVRGVPVMANYQIVANKKAYYYQCGRSLDVPERIRPGIVMVAFALQHAIAHGLREYDFLGGAAQYKMEFTDTTRPIVELRVAQNGPREWLRSCIEIAIGFARTLRNAMRACKMKQ